MDKRPDTCNQTGPSGTIHGNGYYVNSRQGLPTLGPAADLTSHIYAWQERLKSQPLLHHVIPTNFTHSHIRPDAHVSWDVEQHGAKIPRDSCQGRLAGDAEDLSERVSLERQSPPETGSSSHLREKKEAKLVPRPGGSESSSNLDEIEVSFQDDPGDGQSFEPGGTSGTGKVSGVDDEPYLDKHDYTSELQQRMQKFSAQDLQNQAQVYNDFMFHQGFPQARALPIQPHTGFHGWEEVGRSLSPDKDVGNGTTAKPCVCTLCGKSFSNNNYLAIHIRSHTGEKPYVCDKCGEQFTSLSHLNGHKRMHAADKPYRCEICDERFGKSNNLVEHKRKHSGERPFSCDICGKSFARTSVLYRHRIIHSTERPFECDLCDKTFTRKGALRRHERVHSGEKPFECDVCNKSFAHNESLSMHKAIHTGEKLFRCDVCDKRFGNRLYLHSHKKIHSEERPYVCNECGDAFKRSGDLNAHKTTHSAEKAFRCELCDKRFTKRSNMQRHKKLHIVKANEQLELAKGKKGRKRSLQMPSP